MKQKLFSGALICALLLTLTACQTSCPPPSESPDPSPSSSVIPTEEVTPSPTPTPTEPVADDSTRYFFADSHFLGAWSNGEWRSCNDGQFTVEEVFNRTYYDYLGESLGAARFYVGEGSGEFEDPQKAANLLEPFGVIEGYDFIMKLPGQLTGEAAALAVPNYNFYVYFEGQPHSFVSTVPFTLPGWSTAHTWLPDEIAIQALEGMGIHCTDLSGTDRDVWACDIDSDGQEEYLELIQNLNNRDILSPGEQCFYAFFLRDGEQVSAVASHAIDYTDDVTSYFSASDVQFRDLDGDGICEIIFHENCWEWGYCYAYAQVDGVWTQVLCSPYGM